MKIFISIASYQDPLLESTIISAYESSKNPENLVFGVCDQSSYPLDIDKFSFKDQIHYEHIDPLYLRVHVGLEQKFKKNLQTKNIIYKLIHTLNSKKTGIHT